MEEIFRRNGGGRKRGRENVKLDNIYRGERIVGAEQPAQNN